MLQKENLSESKSSKEIYIDHDDIIANSLRKESKKDQVYKFITKLYEYIPFQIRERVDNLLFQVMNHSLFIKIKEFLITRLMKLKNIGPFINYLVNSVDKFIEQIIKNQDVKANKKENLNHYTKSSVSYGKRVILGIFIFFVIWGSIAPLKSAAMIEGLLVHESKKRIMQHHTGGIIKRVYVKDGDVVQNGELLMTLDKTSYEIKYDSYKLQLISLMLERSRLLAERNNEDRIKIEENILKECGKDEVAILMRTQEALFNARKASFEGKIAIKEDNIKIYSNKLEALSAQLEAYQKQLDIYEEELSAYSKLGKKGIISKDIVRRYEQQVADLHGRKTAVLSGISETKGYVLLNEKDINFDKSNYYTEIERELHKNQENINIVKANILMIQDEIEKLDITSPITGIVSNICKYTEDGILPREYPILEIIPLEDKLVFDARIRVNDIEDVRRGKEVSVRLMPFKSRVVPPINGNITYISADVVLPQHHGDIPHYKARIELDKESLNKTLKINGIELYPGMMGSGTIDIESRTFFSYLFEPITNSFRRAFIEQ